MNVTIINRRLLGIFIACLSLAAIAAVVWLVWPRPVVPAKISQQYPATVFLPKESATTRVDRNTVKYDSKLKLLTMTLTASGTKMVLSEQPTPDTFVDIPQAYDKVISNMQEYESFETSIGRVHLVKPQELHGKQAAVLSSKGTLLFAKPDDNLDTDDWRRFFKGLTVLE